MQLETGSLGSGTWLPRLLSHLLKLVSVFARSYGNAIFNVTCVRISIRSISFQKQNFEPRHEISNNVVCATSKGSDQPAHTRSLIRAFASRCNIL